MTIKDATAIVGIGQTEWGKGLEDAELVLALRAIKAALDDAGIEPGEVDGLSSYTLETSDEAQAERVANAYIAYTRRVVTFAEEASTRVFGREIPQRCHFL